jgi:hypothetical protein
MKFITNKIHFGQPNSNKVASIMKAASGNRNEAQIKTASAEDSSDEVEDLEKEANLDNIPDDKKAEPFGKKDEDDSSDDKDEKESDVESQCDVEDEDDDEEVEVEASTKNSVKVADKSTDGTEKYDAGKVEGDLANDPGDAESADKVSDSDPKPEGKKTTKTQDGTFPSSGQPEWEGKPENNNDPKMPDANNVEASADSLVKEALSKLDGRFVPLEKVANMTPEIKERTRQYMLKFWPKEYVDSALAEK